MKKILISIVSLLFVLLAKNDCYAAEKSLGIKLESEYSQATFYFDFDTEQEYEINITSPDGTKIHNTINGATGNISVSDITPGEYNILINALDEIKVTARVECQNSKVNTSASEINVSSSVVGLKMWFDNGNLKMKWEDTNLGKINVLVTNPDTMQNIGSGATEKNSFSLSIPLDVRTIEVYIVPASSAKISGAGSRYTLDVVRYIDAECIFPDRTLVNESVYSFSVNSGNGIHTVVTENGDEVFNDVFSLGTHDITVPLNDIDNDICVFFYDEKGNVVSYEQYVKRDIIAPKITLGKIEEETKKDSVHISGSVTETKLVHINEYDVETDSAGRFSFDYELSVGETPLRIYASDEAGNIAEIEYVITRRESSFIVLYVVVAVAFLLVTFVVRKHRPRKGDLTEACEEEKKEKPLILRQIKRERRVVAHKEKPIKELKKEKVKRSHITNNLLVTNSLIKRRKKLSFTAKIVSATFVFILCITFLTRIVKVTEVMSASMEPALKTKDYAIYNQLAYILHTVQRGDIICFYSEENKKDYSKRVIGVAGDEIVFKDGYVIINGERAIEMYIPEDIETNSTKEFVVPEGYVFVLGDNRENSFDARFWDNPYVSIDDIYGKYIGSF